MLTYDVPLYLMNPRQTQLGVNANGKLYRSAFKVEGKYRPYVLKRVGKERYPIQEVRLPIKDDVNTNFSYHEQDLQRRLLDNFSREIKVMKGLFNE